MVCYALHQGLLSSSFVSNLFNMQDGPNREQDRNERRCGGKRNHLVGLFLLVIGAVLLMRQFNIDLPYWLFTWPMILIVVGLFVGAVNGFKDYAWLILIAIGSFFLLDRLIPGIDISNFIFPAIVIGIGLIVLLGPRLRRKSKDTHVFAHITTTDTDPDAPWHQDDRMETVAAFGGVKKTVFSKNFKGGEIINIFGGAEINLGQADFKGVVTLEIVQIFGGTKLIVPSHWEVRTAEAVAIFGGVDDKRSTNAITADDKVLIVRGVTIFGGLEIRSY